MRWMWRRIRGSLPASLNLDDQMPKACSCYSLSLGLTLEHPKQHRDTAGCKESLAVLCLTAAQNVQQLHGSGLGFQGRLRLQQGQQCSCSGGGRKMGDEVLAAVWSKTTMSKSGMNTLIGS
jgi:hypothetical protein